MSTTALERQTSAIAIALHEAGVSLAPDGALRWRLGFRAWPRPVDARLDGEWLLLDGPLPEGARAWRPWDLLLANARLGGLVKFALASDGEPRVRAELPVDDPGRLGQRVRDLCADFAGAAELLRRRPAEAPDGSPTPLEAPADAPSLREALGPSCEAAGWTFTERSTGELRVALDVRETFHQACVERQGGDGLRVSVELARFDRLSPLTRRALGTLLLCACGLVRLARGAVVARGSEEATACFEVRFTLPLAAGELDHALSALTAAARLCGREVDALRSEPLASAYLSVHESGSPVIRLTAATFQPHEEDCHAIE